MCSHLPENMDDEKTEASPTIPLAADNLFGRYRWYDFKNEGMDLVTQIPKSWKVPKELCWEIESYCKTKVIFFFFFPNIRFDEKKIFFLFFSQHRKMLFYYIQKKFMLLMWFLILIIWQHHLLNLCRSLVHWIIPQRKLVLQTKVDCSSVALTKETK